METLHTCPACGQSDGLLALGVRYDHPYRWRPWVITLTQLYLCERCEQVVAVGEGRHGGRGNRARAGRPRVATCSVAR